MSGKYTLTGQSIEQSNQVAGAWKFSSDTDKPCHTSAAELVVTARMMVETFNSRLKFTSVMVRGTAARELGICFVGVIEGFYDFDPKLQEKETLMDLMRDFMMKNHGMAFKGHDLGFGITEIVLKNS